uniref:Uncharacterized protein n=3 Tax=Phaeomonas parva TaxID=124430 RepID=A0A7S1TXB0_9STRA|mmetsp:Transcript_21419/g.65429  ORF Transcript_21419/g.65429 Transcript_21419/m.65429 type:complete len:102 (+) Transcript_21419:131-436(+)
MFISSFGIVTPTIQSFDCCTACSGGVVNAFAAGGADWAVNMLQNPAKLEEVSLTLALTLTLTLTLTLITLQLSGIQKLREVEVDMDWDDDEDEYDDDSSAL